MLENKNLDRYVVGLSLDLIHQKEIMHHLIRRVYHMRRTPTHVTRSHAIPISWISMVKPPYLLGLKHVFFWFTVIHCIMENRFISCLYHLYIIPKDSSHPSKCLEKNPIFIIAHGCYGLKSLSRHLPSFNQEVAHA